MWNLIAQDIARATGQSFDLQDRRSVGGGSINQTFRITDGDRDYFLKLNQASQYAMFEAEALGLREMAETQTIRVPKPICWGTAEGSCYIVMEYLPLGNSSRDSWYQMGQDLAAMHRVTSDRGFGWQRDNTIGDTPQKNPWTDDWVEFYVEHRLRYQFQLANRRGNFRRQEELMAAVPSLLAGHTPEPSLVHGDLWSGNASVTVDGTPVILDPATYYGDREVDIAMSELFGRFPQPFYDGYNATYPLEPGYETRKILYNLYHIINHFNLFGGGYGSQAQSMMDRLLR
ncbi:fructosamine kinase family protein [Leptolyngbya iicbica]|uniref:Fructosamine kinase family protein n=2 Tax=Cyanophyceae TaxID=3028117 RepID=A0A4V2E1Y7_9CYAN|nr:fructosamine kinase family protein [Leptolyngbya sp. LK]RZM75991.1 fructosamine kinase family protein [Leptolyngbya sp. LK]